MRILQSCNRVSISVWLHYLVSNEMLVEKARWEQRKKDVNCWEQIREASVWRCYILNCNKESIFVKSDAPQCVYKCLDSGSKSLKIIQSVPLLIHKVESDKKQTITENATSRNVSLFLAGNVVLNVPNASEFNKKKIRFTQKAKSLVIIHILYTKQ